MTVATDRFWRKVAQGEHGCWLWAGAISSRGYGQWGVRGVSKSAHRVAWTELRGDIPDHLQIDHLCAVKHCVNPWHMELVTSRVNNERRWSAPASCPLPPGTTSPWRRPMPLDERRNAERYAARRVRIAEIDARGMSFGDYLHALLGAGMAS
jgi:hypothetical protein